MNTTDETETDETAETAARNQLAYMWMLSVKTLFQTRVLREGVVDEKTTELKAAKKDWADKLTKATQALNNELGKPKPKGTKAQGAWIDRVISAASAHQVVEDDKAENISTKEKSKKDAEAALKSAETAVVEVVAADPRASQLSLEISTGSSMPTLSPDSAQVLTEGVQRLAESDDPIALELTAAMDAMGFDAASDGLMAEDGDGGGGDEAPPLEADTTEGDTSKDEGEDAAEGNVVSMHN